MEPYLAISFDNTELAFQYKSDKELKKARFIYSTMSHPWLVKLGIKITPSAIRMGLPIKGLIRKTIFAQFVGGETLEQTTKVAEKLEKYNVKAILDYGVEGKEGEENFENACNEFIRVINYAGSEPNVPFISVKVTGFIRFNFLEKLNETMLKKEGTLMKRFLQTIDEFQVDEK
jgi:proline dehydrogenase